MTDIVLSILIPSVPERMTHLKRMIDTLYEQAQNKPVEILVMLENKKRSTGEKRNILVEQAKGEYVAFVDDDDRVDPNYVDTLCATIASNSTADCIVFDVSVNYNNLFTKITKFGKELEHKEDENFYYRKPNHVMCYAKRIAVQHKFLNISYGEDDEWGARVSQDIVNQVRIPATLYHYDYVPKPASWYT
ncbi:glycosyltransferase family 2 protein [Bacillus mycoides]|uniref:glycosyltransferase family A protein n=1 Tax=Bacillus mycoides TaxID=1405 RepID=UPI001C014546|nr:glycosyltransferase family A protein [Bacillus mycoides]QWG27102.1 glycosyltransferase family 2 protein [Bacillus mycoides]